jgi:hypothetical protein
MHRPASRLDGHFLDFGLTKPEARSDRKEKETRKRKQRLRKRNTKEEEFVAAPVKFGNPIPSPDF